MNAILGTMAGLKYKVRHEKLLFGLRMLFSFFGRGGVEWGGVGANRDRVTYFKVGGLTQSLA